MEQTCHYVDGDVIEVFSSEDLDQLKDPNCIIEEGVTIRFYVNEYEQPQNGEVSKAKKVQQKETKKMDEVKQEEPVVEQTTQVEVEEKEETTTAIVQPETPPFDINQILTTTGGGGGVAIILAIIAVVGGAAGWKFWQKLSEQKHEQKMKQLEIQAQSQGLNGAQPPPCQAANVALETKITAIEGKLSSIEKKTSSFSAGFDSEEFEDRIIKLEKKVKTLSKGTNI